MRYAQIREMDIANGPGIRASLFVQGCTHGCKGCFNKEAWDFNSGNLWNRRIQEQFFQLGEKDYIKGYSILGGEPLQQGKEMLELVKYIKEKSKKTIWMWTGYRYEELDDLQKEIVSYVDVLVDGKFIEEQKDLTLKYAGSKNQRVLSLEERERIDTQTSVQNVTKCGII